MSYKKTAVSIESSIFEQGEDLARELRISRSQLYTRALQALIRQRKMRDIQEQIESAEAALKSAGRAEESETTAHLHRAANATMRRAIERGESTW